MYIGNMMRNRLKTRHLIWMFCLGTLLSFQNCSEPLDTSAGNELTTATAGLPFAYVAAVDTIAYMSCDQVPSSYPQSAYFTFMAGAFNSLGLSLTTQFYNDTLYYNNS